jgi:transketolase
LRRAFASTLAELAANDERIVLLTGDLGYMALEPFSDRVPERFINAGVAEQNMVGMATGLAEAGFVPFCYSIATFASLRPYEMIRNGPIAHGLPVRIVGVGGGFEYGHNGISHYPLEDVGIMRVQPGITVVTPADHEQARAAVLATWDLPGPIYYRLGKDDTTVVTGLDGRFELGRAELIRPGSDVVLLALGPAALDALDAAERLQEADISAAVVVVATVNPSPSEDLVRLMSGHRLAVSVEAHYVNGGLGSLVAETIAEAGLPCRLLRSGVASTPDGRSGAQSYLHGIHGISAERIRGQVVEALA